MYLRYIGGVNSNLYVFLTQMKRIEVVAAIIVNEDKILCVQRGEHKYNYISRKYEFPGGKIEDGERKEKPLLGKLMKN